MHFHIPLKVHLSVIVNIHNVFIQLFDVYLACFQFYASTNNAATNTCVNVYAYFDISLGIET